MMRKSIIITTTLLFTFVSITLKAQTVDLKTNNDSISYCFGLLYAKNLQLQGFENIDKEAFYKGFNTYFGESSPVITVEQANILIQDYFQQKMEAIASENLKKGQAFLEENKKVEGVVELPSGLQYKVLQKGTGSSPGSADMVTVHYRGTLVDGTVFDSSFEMGKPVSFRLNQVIKGWQEGIQLMSEGSKWMLYIPPALGYGEQGTGDVIGPNSVLIFEVELISVNK